MTVLCRFLGEQLGTEACSTCSGSVRLKVYGCRHPAHERTRLDQCRRCPDFEAAAATKQIALWSVGVTTAPRRSPTLDMTLSSLQAAGWSRPHLFAEPETEIPAKWQHLPLTLRPETRGAFPNWYLALTEMFMTEPHADAYFLCQDDVLFAAGLREYLERRLWPAPQAGVVSVYCPSHYAVGLPVGFHVENRGSNTWGALAYIFPNPSVRHFLSSPLALEHRFRGRFGGVKQIDCVVGEWCLNSELPYFVHTPSLVQHLGDTSTVSNSSNTGKRRADRFVADVRDI